MKRYLCNFPTLLIVLLVGLLPACPSSQTPAPATPLKAVTLDSTIPIAAGQSVYVPIYSHIYMWERSRTLNLTATLSVRNPDLTQPMILTTVDYYNSDGQRVRNYLEQSVELGPMASTSFVVDQEDTSGGSGAAFVVEWVAQQEVAVPVIEAIMINTSGNQGISFISPGRVIKNRTARQDGE
jgi:Protein of unknown function (DUF3124)